MDYDASCGTRTGIRDRHRQQLVNYVANDLDRVVAGLVANRVPYEQTTTRQGCSTSNVGIVLVQVRQRTVVYKLVQYVT